MGKSERKIQLEKGYMECRNKGMTNSEIAEYFRVSTWTLYHSLQKIADDNGVTRESLLDVPQEQHKSTKSLNRRKIEKVDPKDLKEEFAELDNLAKEIIVKIDQVLQEEEQ